MRANRLPAAASRRAAAMPAAPAPTTTTSTEPERGGPSGAGGGAGRGAASVGVAAAAAEAARKLRRLRCCIGRGVSGRAWSSMETARRGRKSLRASPDSKPRELALALPQRRTTMLDAVAKSLAQMLSPPFRIVLIKSVGLALVLVVLIGIGLHRLLAALAGAGEGWAEGVLGVGAHSTLVIIGWIVSIAAGLGIVAGAIFLMPAVTALVASFFADEIALEVERTHYPDEPLGTPVPLAFAVFQGLKTALLAIGVYLVALLLLLFAGIGVVIFFLATAFLLGREYFHLAAMRYRPPAEAMRMRKDHSGTVFIAGMFIAGFVAIPIVNLATPLFGT